MRPSVEALLITGLKEDLALGEAGRPGQYSLHRPTTCATARPSSSRLIESNGLVVVGAEYCLETGVVSFFDGVPGTS